jgi:hypothetical protein
MIFPLKITAFFKQYSSWSCTAAYLIFFVWESPLLAVITTRLSSNQATGIKCIREIFTKCWRQWKPPLIKANVSGDHSETQQRTFTRRDCERLSPIYMWIENKNVTLQKMHHFKVMKSPTALKLLTKDSSNVKYED